MPVFSPVAPMLFFPSSRLVISGIFDSKESADNETRNRDDEHLASAHGKS